MKNAEPPLQMTDGSSQSFDAQTSHAGPGRRIDTFWSPGEEALDPETGRAIGHDFARLSMPLPTNAERAVVEGYASAKHSQSRSLRNNNNQREAADPGARKLVRLRYSAWRRNRIVDKTVTPHFLNLIQVSHCPITRVELTHGAMLDTDATIDRVYNDGAYAVGNLAVLSQRANLVKANRLPAEVCAIARSGEALEGLTNAEWRRMACLCEMASPSEQHDGVWPLLVIPPNGLMINNPLVLVMEFLSVLACGMIPYKLYGTARNIFSGKKEKRAYDEFLAAYGGRSYSIAGVQGEMLRHKMGDLWGEEPMWNLFLKLFKYMDTAKIKNLSGIAERAFYGEVVNTRRRELVARSWHLDTRGYALPN